MKKLITTLAATLVAATAAQADVLATWDFTGLASTGGPAAATTVGAGLTAGDLALGAGLPTGGAGWPDAVSTFADWQVSSSLEFAISAGGNDYFGFTLTPDAGKTASYDNIFSRFVVNAGGADASLNFTLMSSETGFTTNAASILGSMNILTTEADEGYTPSAFDADWDVSGVAALQDVATATDFRIYVWKDYGGNRIGIGKTWSGETGDDLRVDGTVVPEPSTLALVGLASTGMFLFRKRFRA